MKRRDLLRNTTGIAVTFGILGSRARALGGPEVDQTCKEATFPKVDKLTSRVAEFVVNTQLTDIPSETIELGKKSILDGLGLALSGSKAETAPLIQQYIRSLGCQSGAAVVLGSAAKLPARFAALANGIAIHVGKSSLLRKRRPALGRHSRQERFRFLRGISGRKVSS